MRINIFKTKEEMGVAAARYIAESINETIAARGEACIILATGASQFDMLETFVTLDIDWSKVTVFHLDEYIGLSISHLASFRKYLKERFVDKISGIKMFHYVDGDNDPSAECRRLGQIIGNLSIDIACVGIGENGHLAFNDPPADFDTEEPYIIVNLDRACREQQVKEGWFSSIDEVPQQAISMSIRQIMKSGTIVCTVPDSRKAEALRNAVEGEISNLVPSSILQKHPNCQIFLDEPAGSLLNPK